MLDDIKKMDLSSISSFNVFLREHNDGISFNEFKFVASCFCLDLDTFLAFVEFVNGFFNFDYYSIQILKNHDCLSNCDVMELVLNIEVYEW